MLKVERFTVAVFLLKWLQNSFSIYIIIFESLYIREYNIKYIKYSSKKCS